MQNVVVLIVLAPFFHEKFLDEEEEKKVQKVTKDSFSLSRVLRFFL
jgi:hypothetical protein